MSTDPYPEVTVDESGIVPPQGARPSEWPKKLRTLTAAELDRLTIDNSGRFYWDGKLVNYDTGPKQLTDKTSESLDHSMDILDRASRDLGGRKSPPTIEGQLAEPAGSSDEPGAVDLDVVRAQWPRRGRCARTGCRAICTTDQTRLTLSRWPEIRRASSSVSRHRHRRLRHGHLRLRRGARLGLQDRRIPERLPGPEPAAATRGYSGVRACSNPKNCPLVHRMAAGPSAVRARFDFRARAGNMARDESPPGLYQRVCATMIWLRRRRRADSAWPIRTAAIRTSAISQRRSRQFLNLLPPKPVESRCAGASEPQRAQPQVATTPVDTTDLSRLSIDRDGRLLLGRQAGRGSTPPFDVAGADRRREHRRRWRRAGDLRRDRLGDQRRGTQPAFAAAAADHPSLSARRQSTAEWLRRPGALCPSHWLVHHSTPQPRQIVLAARLVVLRPSALPQRVDLGVLKRRSLYFIVGAEAEQGLLATPSHRRTVGNLRDDSRHVINSACACAP